MQRASGAPLRQLACGLVNDAQTLRQPAEWAPHSAMWLAPPHSAAEWGAALAGAQQEFLGLLRALADLDADRHPVQGEPLSVLVQDEPTEAWLRDALPEVAMTFVHLPYGDVWLRDTGPIFVHDAGGAVVGHCFDFDGWGGKYMMPGDAGLAARLAAAAGLPRTSWPLTLEGGSIEVDGAGTALTTRDCLLQGGRRALGGGTQPASELEWQTVLQRSLGIEQLIWLQARLQHDHTDGHIDTLARFVEPGVVVCMEPSRGDPNEEALRQVLRTLQAARDASGRRLQVLTVPSPGRVEDLDGVPMPASYCNFVIANTVVVVPCYDVAADELAVERLQQMFPQRRVVGAPAKWLLHGGGAFHCMTQQQPAPRHEDEVKQ